MYDFPEKIVSVDEPDWNHQMWNPVHWDRFESPTTTTVCPTLNADVCMQSSPLLVWFCLNSTQLCLPPLCGCTLWVIPLLIGLEC